MMSELSFISPVLWQRTDTTNGQVHTWDVRRSSTSIQQDYFRFVESVGVQWMKSSQSRAYEKVYIALELI